MKGIFVFELAWYWNSIDYLEFVAMFLTRWSWSIKKKRLKSTKIVTSRSKSSDIDWNGLKYPKLWSIISSRQDLHDLKEFFWRNVIYWPFSLDSGRQLNHIDSYLDPLVICEWSFQFIRKKTKMICSRKNSNKVVVWVLLTLKPDRLIFFTVHCTQPHRNTTKTQRSKKEIWRKTQIS